MKRSRIALASIALVGVGALALAGCASGGGSNESTGGSSDAVISANGSEPQNPLIPTNTNETGGGKILDSIFAGLVYYDANGAPVNDVAEEITTEDPQHLTVKIKEGLTFTDGEEITADNFIKAWNYGALASNEQLSSYFFEDIEGFSYDEDSELTGLAQVDDYTFTIALNKPASDFALRLGYSAFYPLPDVAFDDMDAFGESPIGNGPYKLAADDAWQHDVEIDLVKNDEYTGGRAAQNGGLKIVFYASQDAAYADLLAGNLDVLDAIPDAALATYESDLGDRQVNQPAAIFQSFTIPESLAHFAGEEGKLRRQAISMAINRQEITDTIFQGTRTPASDFTSPVIDGWSDSLEGADVLGFDADKAKELWAEADAISPWDGTFQIAYNSDGGHQSWVDATTNSIKNTLGIEASGAPYVDFASLRTEVTNRTITTAFRTGWQADYPGLYNFLGPLYATNAGSNDGDYSNAEFDQLLSDGISSTDPATANEDFQSAQEILLQDLPAIPLWYSNVNGGFAETVDNVQFGWNSVPLYYAITKA
ncbi:ABC transporter substrate-binding protein [Microbacterium sp. cx-55]|uniref:peptide ABC transporter substrate-binding protein n=1 Tax=unclassified Microbacterium TaxID=2609290 RepID=UPI001CBF2D83|nr:MULTISPECIES: ABC transporter substrate-binding protein [unclassified Microbacterium]MBZ4485884.1 ABC transporter substrate-binding protein [Microbacterium sp. cx-55]MCC4906844.1 ABC transporter substrate-binding protein [Microbacterium sp. cx-59]UGB34240.1 ABC transporter substrate-binding protein [Microbacterium sp. cx-55]